MKYKINLDGIPNPIEVQKDMKQMAYDILYNYYMQMMLKINNIFYYSTIICCMCCLIACSITGEIEFIIIGMFLSSILFLIRLILRRQNAQLYEELQQTLHQLDDAIDVLPICVQAEVAKKLIQYMDNNEED